MAQLCSLVGASEEEEPLLGSVQGYMEQAAKKVQHALSSVQQSEMATQARYSPTGFFSCSLSPRPCGSEKSGDLLISQSSGVLQQFFQ